MRPIESYRLGWRSLTFLDKHVVIGTLFAVIGTVFTVGLTFAVFRLQEQTNYLQERQFRIEDNVRSAKRARLATRAAFGIESMRTLPGSERIVPASGSQRR